jgi:hypothetical protein
MFCMVQFILFNLLDHQAHGIFNKKQNHTFNGQLFQIVHAHELYINLNYLSLTPHPSTTFFITWLCLWVSTNFTNFEVS